MDRRSFIKAIGSASLFPSQYLWAWETKSIDYSIAFGSCNRQSLPQDFWKTIAGTKPDVWFGLGDTIYADTKNKSIFKNKYRQLLESEYRNFKKRIPIEGVWDDHDYGVNNGDKSYSFKETSQELYLDFLNVPSSDPRRNRPGIYYSKDWLINGQKIKVYFLDCRYFKDRPYKKQSDILGDDQWGWFEDELAHNMGDINIIVSPFGVLKNRLHVTEDWDDYKKAKQKLMALMEYYNPPGLFFLSGDKHFGAFIETDLKLSHSKQTFHEFQSSGLTHGLEKVLIKPIEAIYGANNMVPDRNFGKINFNLSPGDNRMTWLLYSLDRPQLIRKKQFILDRNGKWIKSETMV